MISGLTLLALLVALVAFVNRLAEDAPERGPYRPILTWS